MPKPTESTLLARKQILIVEDESDVSLLLATHFKRQGASVTPSSDGEDAIRLLQKKRFDLLVLDWMLPGISGLEIVQFTRLKTGLNQPGLPILMLTAKADPGEIVRAIDLGANDYVTKPFDVSVVLARSRALLRKGQTLGDPESLRIGRLTLCPEDLSVSSDHGVVNLTPCEFQVLFQLASNPGRVLTRSALLERLQTKDKDVTLRTIDTHVFGLRRKLGKSADLIETIRGIGYRVLHPAPEADDEATRICASSAH